MAGFRVQEHTKWRRGPAEPDAASAEVTRTARPPRRTVTAPSDEERVDDLAHRVRSLGAVGWPARAYDAILGGWHGRGATFLAARFLLVVIAVALLAGGVSGDTPIVYQTREYQNVTPANVVDTYVTESTVHVYPIQVGRSPSDHVRASFGSDAGDVAVPGIDGSTTAHALRVHLVRKDPTIAPVLLLSTPGQSHRSISPSSDDSVVMRFPPIRLTEPGEWELVVHSSKGIGHVEMHLSVAEAEVVAVEAPSFGWGQIAAGLGMLTILLGAYTPGAALLRERRRIGRVGDERAWQEAKTNVLPDDARGFARMHPRRRGVMKWQRPGEGSAEGLAEGPGRGWVIRLD